MVDNILKKISLKSINYYIEKNLDDFYIKASTHSNFSSHIEKKISWVLAKEAGWPEGVFKAEFENLNVEEEISTVVKLIQEGKAPNGWTVGPLTTPKNLGSILERFGFSNVYHQAGMALELEDITNQEITENGLEIEIVKDKDHLRQWIDVVSTVFGIQIDFELLNYLFFEPEARFYIGNFESKPVTSLMLYISSGVAGLHAVSTLKEYRGRGFGLAISIMALLDAFKMGYKVGVLQASALGENLYRKLGFRKFCDIISYELEI
ncbi:MAG: GNAT family N-acetyltransferase [Promethearchaeota archaeon]|jgi:GNAT superfamily N-acetyltransferase